MRYDDRRVAGSKGVTLSAPRVVPDLPESFHIQFASPIRQICFAGNPYQTNEAKGTFVASLGWLRD